MHATARLRLFSAKDKKLCYWVILSAGWHLAARGRSLKRAEIFNEKVLPRWAETCCFAHSEDAAQKVKTSMTLLQSEANRGSPKVEGNDSILT